MARPSTPGPLSPDSTPLPFLLLPTSEYSLSGALANLLTQHFEQILEVFRSDDLPVAREVGHGGGAGGGPFGSSAGALDGESFSQTICGRRLRQSVRLRTRPRTTPKLAVAPARAVFIPGAGPPLPKKTGWPLLPPRLPPHLGGSEPRPAAQPPLPSPLPPDLALWAGPGFAGDLERAPRARGGTGRRTESEGWDWPLSPEGRGAPGADAQGSGSEPQGPVVRVSHVSPTPGVGTWGRHRGPALLASGSRRREGAP